MAAAKNLQVKLQLFLLLYNKLLQVRKKNKLQKEPPMVYTSSTHRKSEVGANCHTVTSLLFLQSDTINVFKYFKVFHHFLDSS